MLTLSSLRQKSFSRAIKVVLRTEAESKAFSLAFQRWKHQVISGKAGLSFSWLVSDNFSSMLCCTVYESLPYVSFNSHRHNIFVFPPYLHHKRVKHLLWALLNFRLHTVILTCTVFLHAHVTLQSGEMSEFYVHTYSNSTFMMKFYVLGHF
jgi:hypothetical protein